MDCKKPGEGGTGKCSRVKKKVSSGSCNCCRLCRLSGSFQCTKKASFKDIVKIPDIKIFAWQNKQVVDENDPDEAERKMMEILTKEWDFTTSDISSMDPLKKKPKDANAADCENKTLEALR